MDTAFYEWLNSVAIILEGERPTMSRTLDQIRMDGLYSIYDFARIRSVAQTWLDLINTDDKRVIVNLLMRLYDMEQITLDLFIETISNLIQ